ncbi:MAG: peptide-N-glycosidase F-related protein [Flavobacteriales bacterium]
MNRILLALSCVIVVSNALAQAGDTTVVQTYTFEEQNNPLTDYDSPGRRWFQFPASDNGVQYQKILMLHTLKCFEDGTAGGLGFPCGEWDYLSYNYLYKHTGIWDSLAATHPRWRFNNADFTSVTYGNIPIADTLINAQSYFVINSVIAEQITPTGTSDSFTEGPFGSAPVQRAQYLYTVGDLTSAGLTAGIIRRLTITPEAGSTGDYSSFSIRMRHTTLSTLGEMQTGTWTDLHIANVSVNGTAVTFDFETGFNWNGTSSLLVECAYDAHEGPAALTASQETNANRAVTSAGNDHFILFDGADEVVVPPAAFENLSDEVTIMFWVNGTAEFQPENGTCFEGVTAANQRVLNTHLPWSNSRVYWDAGEEGGYDRIDKLANPANFEEQWNHWAFTKNAVTGVMRIYLNGTIWHSGTNRFRTMEDIVKFTIGGAAGWSNFYRGGMNEFSIWDKELDAATIAAMRFNSIPQDHPEIAHLLVYYMFDETEGQVIDHSGNEFHGTILGNPQRLPVAGGDYFLNPQISTRVPVLQLHQGEYAGEIVTQTFEQIIPHPPVSIAEYAVSGNSVILADVQYGWPSSWAYTINADGVAIDSTWIEGTTALVNETLSYFLPPFEITERYELGRYITPYGIQLDMGEGWTWIFDVTDFAPLLRDSVELECGNWQELLDLKFLFIEGTPAREVRRIENGWVGNYGLNNFNDAVPPLTITPQAGEVGVKLRTTLTGHGFGNNANNCGEFCYNTHTLTVNNTPQWSWEIMQECDQNPLYPQGGTWIYARAGWCPGAPSRTEEFELTPFLGNNNSVTVEYGIETDPFGNYVTESQVVFYGPLNHAIDASVEQILAPSDFLLHSRWNPMCDNPRFVLINKGSQPLTQATIQYRVTGGEVETFTWTGNLGFMESEEVELTYSQQVIWMGDDATPQRFYLDIIVAGDENPSNNHAESRFLRPALYTYMTDPDEEDDNRMIVILKTNLANNETSWAIRDINGNTVHSRNNFPEANTIYRDTIALNAGCYTFHLFDTGGDGLDFFANNDGSGYCRLDRVAGADFISFERDFGQDILHSFQWDTQLVSVEEQEMQVAELLVFPNPANESFYVRASGYDRNLSIRVTHVNGQLMFEDQRRVNNPGERISIPCQHWAPGIYQVTVTDGTRRATQRLVRMN